MRWPLLAAAVAAMLAVAPLLSSPLALAAPAEDPALRLVGFVPGAPAPLEALASLGALVVRVDERLAFAVVAHAEPARFDALAQRLPGVAYVEPDHPLEVLAYRGTDALQPEQWGLERVRAPEAWTLLPERTRHVTVAVLDTGADWFHPDLGPVVWNGNMLHGDDLTGYATAAQCALEQMRARSCFYMDQPPEEVLGPMDFHGHGTHVAGIVGALRDGDGVAGVAPVSLHVIKVLPLGSSAYSSADVVATGIGLAAARGADVISLSLGGPYPSTTLQRAVDFAWKEGSLVVAAAGNLDEETTLYPAGFRDVVGVAATGPSDARWVAGLGIGSSMGPHVDLAAPGQDILSSQARWATNFGFVQVGLGWRTMSGTSMATPFVAGAAALAWEANPRLSNAEVRALLLGSARDLGRPGWDPEFGWGLVDAEAAVQAALSLP